MSEKIFLLVRWMEDETVGVVPVTAVKKGQEFDVGAYVETKFKKKFYESEVLKISGKYFLLNFNRDKNFLIVLESALVCSAV